MSWQAVERINTGGTYSWSTSSALLSYHHSRLSWRPSTTMPALIYSTNTEVDSTTSKGAVETLPDSGAPESQATTAEVVAQTMHHDSRASHTVYLLSHQRHLSAYPMSHDDDAVRKTLRERSGGYEPREYRDIRKAYDLDSEWPALPFISLDGELQAHFTILERTPTTCHPIQICDQVTQAVDALFRAKEADPRMNIEKEIARLAEAVYAAGTSDIRNSRSVAIFVHQLLADLKTLTRDLKATFRKQLLDLAFKEFREWWQVNRLLTSLPRLRTLIAL